MTAITTPIRFCFIFVFDLQWMGMWPTTDDMLVDLTAETTDTTLCCKLIIDRHDLLERSVLVRATVGYITNI